MVRNHCSYSSPTQNLHLKSSVHSGGDIGHMPPPVSQLTSSAQSSSSLIHSPDPHSNSSANPSGLGIKKESSSSSASSMAIQAMNDDLISVPASHYGLVSLQIAAAVKKAQQITEKRCGTQSSAHLYQKAHISNAVVNNHSESQSAAELLGNQHIENGNNGTASATITTTSTNNNFVRRYSDDYYAKDDLPSGSHLLHQQVFGLFVQRKQISVIHANELHFCMPIAIGSIQQKAG